jgi:hypothetical protein
MSFDLSSDLTTLEEFKRITKMKNIFRGMRSARTQIELAIEDIPSLGSYPAEQLKESYEQPNRSKLRGMRSRF